MAVLGVATGQVDQREAAVILHAHDVLTQHHDRNFRCLALFLAELLADRVVVVVRLDHQGGAAIDCLWGVRADSADPHPPIALLINRGHMRVLRCPCSWRRGACKTALVKENLRLQDDETAGWGEYLSTPGDCTQQAPTF